MNGDLLPDIVCALHDAQELCKKDKSKYYARVHKLYYEAAGELLDRIKAAQDESAAQDRRKQFHLVKNENE